MKISCTAIKRNHFGKHILRAKVVGANNMSDKCIFLSHLKSKFMFPALKIC